jgi:DNA-directed RNA polymerase subunit RPC12/RpoP
MANEKRLIDANVVLAKQFTAGLSDASGNYYGHADVVFVDDIENAPTVDAVEVVHGRWEQVQRWATKAKYRCSVCGREIMSATKVNIEKYPYCHCGAKMDGGNEDV